MIVSGILIFGIPIYSRAVMKDLERRGYTKQKDGDTALYTESPRSYKGRIVVGNGITTMAILDETGGFSEYLKEKHKFRSIGNFVAAGQTIRVDYGISSRFLIGLEMGYVHDNKVLYNRYYPQIPETDYQVILVPTNLAMSMYLFTLGRKLDMIVGTNICYPSLEIREKRSGHIVNKWTGRGFGLEPFLRGQYWKSGNFLLHCEMAFPDVRFGELTSPLGSILKDSSGEYVDFHISGFIMKGMVSVAF